MNWISILIASCVFIIGFVFNSIFNKQEDKEIKELEELNKKLEELSVILKEDENEKDKEVVH